MRARKAMHNFATNVLMQLTAFVLGLILPRLYIASYGSEANGMLSSIRSLLAYFTVVEGGVKNASISTLYAPISARDQPAVNGILSASRVLLLRAGYIFLSLVCLLALVYPLLVSKHADPYTAGLTALLLGTAGFIELASMSKHQVLLTADQRLYLFVYVQIAGMLMNASLVVSCIALGANIVAVAASAVLVSAAKSLLLRIYIGRNYPNLNYRSLPNEGSIGQRKSAFIHQFSGMLIVNLPILLITLFCGLSEVSVYAVYAMVFSGVATLISGLNDGMLAGFGDIISRGEKASLRRGFESVEFVYYAFIAGLYAVAFLLMPPFIEIYTRGFHDADYSRPLLIGLFLVVSVLQNVRELFKTMVYAAGRFQQTRNGAYAECGINVGASLIFVSWLGMEGALLGSICSYAYRTIELARYASAHILECSLLPTLRKLVRNAILSMLAATPFLIAPISASNLLQLAAWGCVALVWSLLVVFAGNALLDRDAARSIWRRARLMLDNRKNNGRVAET